MTSAVHLYVKLCRDSNQEAALELVNALSGGHRECVLSDRTVPLTDKELVTISEALRLPHSLRMLDLDGNHIGVAGLQSLLAGMAANPSIRELRLGRNDLGDPAAAVLGNFLANNGVGLRVLDLSLNAIGNIGCIAIFQALSSRNCHITEISLHGNRMHADCGIPIAQAIKQTTSLKHLHLGFNGLRDAGAIHIGRALTSTQILSSLDLTGNGIGPQGGKELAWWIMSGSTLQRLNLRHNLFDDDTFRVFAEVIQAKTHLTHLFLGFMSPSPQVAELVFRSLERNTSLLLFDAMEWALAGTAAGAAPRIIRQDEQILRNIASANDTIRAILTDAFAVEPEALASMNKARGQRGVAPVYVGVDERAGHTVASAPNPQPAPRSRSPPQPTAVTVSGSARRNRSPASATKVTASVAEMPTPMTATGRVIPPTSASQQQEPLLEVTGDESEWKLLFALLERSGGTGEVLAVVKHLHLRLLNQRSSNAQQIGQLESKLKVAELRVRELETRALNKSPQNSTSHRRTPSPPASSPPRSVASSAIVTAQVDAALPRASAVAAESSLDGSRRGIRGRSVESSLDGSSGVSAAAPSGSHRSSASVASSATQHSSVGSKSEVATTSSAGGSRSSVGPGGRRGVQPAEAMSTASGSTVRTPTKQAASAAFGTPVVSPATPSSPVPVAHLADVASPHASTPAKHASHPATSTALASVPTESGSVKSPELQHSLPRSENASLGTSPPKQDRPKRPGLRFQGHFTHA